MYDNKLEIGVGAMSAFFASVAALAEGIDIVDVSVTPSFLALISQFGGLLLCIFLVLHNTLKTIPNLIKDHREALEKQQESARVERTEIIERFNAELDEKRRDYLDQLNQQRKDFADILSRFQPHK